MAKKNAIITHNTIVDERRKSVLADMFKGSAQNSCQSSRFVSLSVSLFACKTSSVYENSVGFIFCYGNHSIACSGKLNLRKRQSYMYLNAQNTMCGRFKSSFIPCEAIWYCILGYQFLDSVAILCHCFLYNQLLRSALVNNIVGNWLQYFVSFGNPMDMAWAVYMYVHDHYYTFRAINRHQLFKFVRVTHETQVFMQKLRQSTSLSCCELTVIF